ncbi:MAG: hypothetical protein MUO80_06260 [Dehalococcoidia bacterium]|nr:hypothetical protein [Dehalococcoidia bacterium]
MVDPASIAIGAAIGGATGAFTKEVWNLGKNWLHSFFKDHRPKAIEKAEQNSLDFLAQLATRVKALEEQGEQQKKVIEDSLNQPDFSILLQKAILSSAQTEDKGKHEILARLVADRLAQDTESLLVLCSKQAVDVIPMLNNRQMKILAFLAAIFYIRPRLFPPPNIPNHSTVLNIWCLQWLEKTLAIYQDLVVHRLDYLHLESLSCIKWDPILSRDLAKILKFESETPKFKFDVKAFLETPLGSKIKQLWNAGLKSALATTVGQVIGVYTSDYLLGAETSFEKFGAP